MWLKDSRLPSEGLVGSDPKEWEKEESDNVTMKDLKSAGLVGAAGCYVLNKPAKIIEKEEELDWEKIFSQLNYGLENLFQVQESLINQPKNEELVDQGLRIAEEFLGKINILLAKRSRIDKEIIEDLRKIELYFSASNIKLEAKRLMILEKKKNGGV